MEKAKNHFSILTNSLYTTSKEAFLNLYDAVKDEIWLNPGIIRIEANVNKDNLIIFGGMDSSNNNYSDLYLIKTDTFF